MLRERLMWIAWPAFLVAAVLEMMVFAVLDPAALRRPSGVTPALCRADSMRAAPFSPVSRAFSLFSSTY